MFWEDDIFEELDRMRRRIDTLMRRMTASFPMSFESFPVDISETEDDIIVRADLPGFDKSDVKVKAGEDFVEISAEKGESKVEKGERFYKSERRIGRFYRRITLPVPVEYENAKAKMENGVLTIRLPKKEKGKAKKEIKIE